MTNCDCPDIAYDVGRLSRYTHSPSVEHCDTISILLIYSKGTFCFCLSYCGYLVVLEGYSNANWISDTDYVKPTSGYVFTLAGRAISWKSSKKTCIVSSNMETELVALEKAGSKAVWLRSLLIDMPQFTNSIISVCFHCDCQNVIKRVKSKVYNGKSQHIQLGLRQLIDNDVMLLIFVKWEKSTYPIEVKATY